MMYFDETAIVESLIDKTAWFELRLKILRHGHHSRESRGGEMGEFSPPPPLFLSPLLSFFISYHLNEALVLLHY